MTAGTESQVSIMSSSGSIISMRYPDIVGWPARFSVACRLVDESGPRHSC